MSEKSQEILHEIAKAIPNMSKGSYFSPRISDVHQSSDWTFEGSAPSTGVHTTDDKLFCGTHSPNRWFCPEVRPFHTQINELWNKHNPNHQKRDNNNDRQSKANQAKQQIKALETSNAQLKIHLSAVQSSQGLGVASTPSPTENDKAGDAFGGRSSMGKKKKAGE